MPPEDLLYHFYPLQELILRFISVFLSWPAIILYLGIAILIKYDGLIKNFLEKVKSVKLKDFEMTQASESTLANSSKLSNRKSSLTKERALRKEIADIKMEMDEKGRKGESDKRLIEAQKKMINFFSNQADQFEFKFLTKILVRTTQLALAHFRVRAYGKIEFMNILQLNAQIEDVEAEKEAIFNALLINGLIEKTNNETFQITFKGRKFLEFLKI